MPRNPKITKVRKRRAPEVRVKPPAERPLAEGQGAPTKRTPERRQAILQALEAMPISLTKAAEAVGISRETLRLWLNEDLAFLGEVDEARSKGVRRNAANLARMASNDPRVALRWAEQADKEFWEHPIVIDIRSVAIEIAAEMGLGDDHAAVERLIEETQKLALPAPEHDHDA